jgi:hypothetical protein
MAYTAGIKRPQQTNSNNSNQQQNTYDRLVTVTGYDTSKGFVYAEDDNKKKYEIFVNLDEYKRAEASLASRAIDISKINWMGHKIDKGMEKSVPVGSKIVLIRSKVISNDKTREGGMAVTEVHRIVGVPNPEADKTFQGIFTMQYRMEEGKKRVARVQHWNPRAININDGDGLEALKNQIDEARKNYGVKLGEFSVTEPTIGVQFRALIKTDRNYALLENRPIYEVIDSSVPLDWIPGPEDEHGKEIKAQAHVLTGDNLFEYAEGYVEHIENQFKEHIDNMRVEVAYYHVYPASRNEALLLTTGDKDKDRNADKNPLYQLSHRVSYVDMAHSDDGLIVGRNAAVNGIIQIAGNKLEKVAGRPVEIPNYWVNKIHANNTRGHVHSFVRSVGDDGLEYKAEPAEQLKLVMTDSQKAAQQNNNESAPSQSNQNASQPKPAPVSSAAPALMQEDPTFDPFSDMGGASEPDPFQNSSAETPARKGLSFGSKK